MLTMTNIKSLFLILFAFILISNNNAIAQNCNNTDKDFDSIEFNPSIKIISANINDMHCVFFLTEDTNHNDFVIYDRNSTEIWRQEISKSQVAAYRLSMEKAEAFLKAIGATEMPYKADRKGNIYVSLSSGKIFSVKFIDNLVDYCGMMFMQYLSISVNDVTQNKMIIRILDNPINLHISNDCIAEEGFSDIPIRIPDKDKAIVIYPWSEDKVLLVGGTFAVVLSDELKIPKNLTDIGVFNADRILNAERVGLDDRYGSISEVVTRMENEILKEIKFEISEKQ